MQVALKLDKKTHMAHEPITGVLTLLNRAGRDIVIDNPARGVWLDYSIHDPRQNHQPCLRREVPGLPLSCAAASLRDPRRVNKEFPMGESGMYRIRARVYFPPLDHYYETTPQTLNIVDGQTLWGPETVGIPTGFPEAGAYRTYSLMTFFQGPQKKSLYFRLAQAKDGLVLRTYSLGDYLTVHPPEQAIDGRSHLHVLHMAGPQAFFYTVIDPTGKVVEQQAYRDKNGVRPRLFATPSGQVTVQGGISVEDLQTPYEQREFHGLSERPPGMPIVGGS
ncbi:MAG: hypothetical protein H7A53_01895 [Akkermansiaceae bacterium]|nr:hypothetical protein [Akkermansiaceae bacterium]